MSQRHTTYNIRWRIIWIFALVGCLLLSTSACFLGSDCRSDQDCRENWSCKEGSCVQETNLCISPKANRSLAVKCTEQETCYAGKCVPSCSKGLTRCGASCFQLKSASKHCGSCNKSCQSEEKCDDGQCVDLCASSLVFCGKSCVDTKSNLAHCGKCDAACTRGEVCKEGKCQPNCPATFSSCEGKCVDLKENSSNCGQCGKKCLVGEMCKNSQCASSCLKSEVLCGGKCTNTMSNSKDCGSCGNLCQAGSICSRGVCSLCTDCPEWAKPVGSIGPELLYGVATDKDGNVYASGYFSATLDLGTIKLKSAGGMDAFVLKMSPKGEFLWAKRAGGLQSTHSYAIAVDKSSNVYITGAFHGIAEFGSKKFASAGDSDGFIAKLDTNGKWMWANQYNSKGRNIVYSIAVDSNGNLCAAGEFFGPLKFGSINVNSNGGTDAFVLKLNSDGKELWAKGAGGQISEQSDAIAVDNQDNIYVTGRFYKEMSWGSFTFTSKGQSDIFVAKLDPTGKVLYASQAGGSTHDYGHDIAIDDAGNVYVTGAFASVDAVFGTFRRTSQGKLDMYVAKLDPSGQWLWVFSGGGLEEDKGRAIRINGNGDVYVTGHFIGDAIFGRFAKLLSTGGVDHFLLQLSDRGEFRGFAKMGGLLNDYGLALSIDGKDNLFVGGAFSSTAHFSSTSLVSKGNTDGFVAKYPNTTHILCPKGNSYAICDGICSDLNIDPLNCSKCGKRCKGGESCSIGKCLVP